MAKYIEQLIDPMGSTIDLPLSALKKIEREFEKSQNVRMSSVYKGTILLRRDTNKKIWFLIYVPYNTDFVEIADVKSGAKETRNRKVVLPDEILLYLVMVGNNVSR